MKIAILDDYQNVALTLADWSRVAGKAEITVFTDHVSDPDEVVARLEPFDAICVMRERTPLPRRVIEQLPRLRMIASTGRRNASIDESAARDHNIEVTATGYSPTPLCRRLIYLHGLQFHSSSECNLELSSQAYRRHA